MKILLINNFYYNRGGDCTYLLSLKKLLESKGNKVIIFSMHHPQNFSSEYSSYFTEYINYADEINKKNIWNALKVITRTIFSGEAKKNIEKLLLTEKPDVVHLQNIHHHITPSIFSIIKKFNIPIIWTLHDYTLICPNTSFYFNNKVCEKCKKIKYYWAPLQRCKKNSLAASFVAALETTIHRITGVIKSVDYFISPSEFLRNKLIEYGFNKDKIITINNFLDSQIDSSSVKNENYYIFLGRLAEEKGLYTLIDAASGINSMKLKIIGDGPLRKELESYAKLNDKNKNIIFSGYKTGKALTDIIKKSQFIVVPSQWYENYPYSILEAFAYEKPVIASDIGGIPEQVKHNKTGLLFKTGDSNDLRQKIEHLINNPSLIKKMGKTAKKFVTSELTPDKHYKKIMDIYKMAIKKNEK